MVGSGADRDSPGHGRLADETSQEFLRGQEVGVGLSAECEAFFKFISIIPTSIQCVICFFDRRNR